MPCTFVLPPNSLLKPAGRFAGEVEVDQLDDVVVAEQEIVGLDVAMDPALVVHVGEAGGGSR